jgi:hypothetical protein
LNRPLKFLIRLLSSFLFKTAIEVAVCSKYSLAVIVLASFTNPLPFYIELVLSVSSATVADFPDKFCKLVQTSLSARQVTKKNFAISILV